MDINSELRYLQRPEGRLAYTVSGTGPLVIAVPGMGDLRSVYRDIAGPIVDSGYRLATMDLRGHGDSDTSFTIHGDAATGNDMLALISELGEPAVIVGNSMSASGAAWAAAEHPDAVAGLVLYSPFLRDPSTNSLAKWAMRLLFRVMFARPWGAWLWTSYYASLNKGTQAPWLGQHKDDIHRSFSRPDKLRSLRHLAVQLNHSEVEVRLPSVSAPALIVMGDRDPDFRSPADELTWATETLDAEGLLVPDTGHYPQAQRPDLVAEATLSFLAKVRPASANPVGRNTNG